MILKIVSRTAIELKAGTLIQNWGSRKNSKRKEKAHKIRIVVFRSLIIENLYVSAILSLTRKRKK